MILLFTKSLLPITDYRKGKIVFTPFYVLSWFLFAEKTNSNQFIKEEWKYIAFTQIFSFLVLFLIRRVSLFISIIVPENNLIWVLLILDAILVAAVWWVKLYSFSWNNFYIAIFAILFFLCCETRPILGIVFSIAISIPTFFRVPYALRQDNYFAIFLSMWSGMFSVLYFIYEKRTLLIFFNNACFVIFYACIHSCIMKLYLNKIEPEKLEKFILDFGRIFGLVICATTLVFLMS